MLSSVDEILERFADGYYCVEAFTVEFRATSISLWSGNFGGQSTWSYVVPTLPSGVTAFIVAQCNIIAGAGYYQLCKAIDMGSLNISTNVFTDGSAMPTVTELNTSRQTYGALWCEVDVATNATPGNLTVTYVDQDGNAAEAMSNVMAIGPSAPIRSACYVPLNQTDVGVMDITAASRTGGTTPTGTLHFYGLMPIGQIYGVSGAVPSMCTINCLGSDLNPLRLAAGDKLLLLGTSTLSQKAVPGWITFLGDT